MKMTHFVMVSSSSVSVPNFHSVSHFALPLLFHSLCNVQDPLLYPFFLYSKFAENSSYNDDIFRFQSLITRMEKVAYLSSKNKIIIFYLLVLIFLFHFFTITINLYLFFKRENFKDSTLRMLQTNLQLPSI